MTARKPLLSLLLLGQSGETLKDALQAAFPSSTPGAFETPNRVYRVSLFERENPVLGVDGALVWVSAKRSLTDELQQELRALSLQSKAYKLVVYLDDCSLFAQDPDVLDLVEQELRAFLEKLGFAQDETPILRGDLSTELRGASLFQLTEVSDQYIPIQPESLQGEFPRDVLLFTRELLSHCEVPPSQKEQLFTEVAASVAGLSGGPIPRHYYEALRRLGTTGPMWEPFFSDKDWSLFERLSWAFPGLSFFFGRDSYRGKETPLIGSEKRSVVVFVGPRGYGVERSTSVLGRSQPGGWNAVGFSLVGALRLQSLISRCQEVMQYRLLPGGAKQEAEALHLQSATSFIEQLHEGSAPQEATPRSQRRNPLNWREQRRRVQQQRSQLIADGMRVAISGAPQGQLIETERFKKEYAMAFLGSSFAATLPKGQAKFLFEAINETLFRGFSSPMEVYRWSNTWSYLLGSGERLWTVLLPNPKHVVAVFYTNTE